MRHRKSQISILNIRETKIILLQDIWDIRLYKGICQTRSSLYIYVLNKTFLSFYYIAIVIHIDHNMLTMETKPTYCLEVINHILYFLYTCKIGYICLQENEKEIFLSQPTFVWILVCFCITLFFYLLLAGVFFRSQNMTEKVICIQMPK